MKDLHLSGEKLFPRGDFGSKAAPTTQHRAGGPSPDVPCKILSLNENSFASLSPQESLTYHNSASARTGHEQ